MKRTGRTIILALYLLSSSAFANISRGAYESGNSSSLTKTSQNDSVVVNHETLEFSCQWVQCDVTATYTITSKSGLKTRLQFVAPLKSSKPAVTVNNSVVAVNTEHKKRQRGKFDHKDRFSSHRYDETRHSFNARFKTGSNTITVKYRQNMSMYTASSFGVYPFLSRKYSFYFAYYLYPLKQWTLSPDFRLTVNIALKPASDPYSKKQSRGARIKCRSLPKQISQVCSGAQCSRVLKPKQYRKQHKIKHAGFEFTKSFPDILECHVGKKIRF